MRIALATSEAWPDLDPDSAPLLAALRAARRSRPAVWSDATVDWAAYDAVVLRSTWDYDERVDEFLADRFAAAILSAASAPSP